jgi:hypothetical protein
MELHSPRPKLLATARKREESGAEVTQRAQYLAYVRDDDAPDVGRDRLPIPLDQRAPEIQPRLRRFHDHEPAHAVEDEEVRCPGVTAAG